MFTFLDVVDIAIKIEQNGERTYRKAAREVTNPDLAAMLNCLADQEADHVEWFAKLRAAAPEGELDSSLAEMGREMLRNTVGDKAFNLDEVDFTKISSLREMVEVAIDLEANTVLFYEMIAGFLQERDTIARVQAIIDEERRHGQVLVAYLDKDEITAELPSF